MGVAGKEGEVYLTLIELGEAAPKVIAQKAGIKRPTAYAVLSALEAKGLAQKVVRDTKVFFAPHHPAKLLTDAEVRLRELKETIPQLESMFHSKDPRPRVVMYHGKQALDKAYDEIFLMEGEAVALSNSSLVQELFGRTLQKLTYRTSAKFRTRELLDDSEAARLYAARHAGPYRQARIMPKEFMPFETDIAVCGNISLITSGKKELFTVKIESQEIANAFHAMFEAMWRISAPALKE